MITRIEGVLESIESGAACVRVEGGLTYEVLLPGYAAARLGGMRGQTVTLHTLHYVESHNQGATLIPRLAGFLSPRDRRFFEVFTSVKGIGMRKALRCMTLDTPMLAGAIADRDAAMLQSLPEIGKRTAETIIVTLKDKVDAFLESAAGVTRGQAVASPATNRTTGDDESRPASGGRMAREAIEVLVKLGENRAQAAMWIDRVLQESGEDRAEDVSALVARVYEVKAGA